MPHGFMDIADGVDIKLDLYEQMYISVIYIYIYDVRVCCVMMPL